MTFFEFLKELTNPESIINYGGVALLLLVVFAETGLLIGFFLPGDSLMFIAGLLCRTKPDILEVDIYELCGLLCLAGILGNIAGYYFGYKVGPALFKRDDSLVFKKKYVTMTRSFYERHGGKTLILGRFLPIIRTFAPILAGVIRVKFTTFMIYNVVGMVLWVLCLTVPGYLLGELVEPYLTWIVVALIIITLIPVLKTYLSEKKRSDAAGPGNPNIQ